MSAPPRKFKLLNHQGEKIGTFTGATPYQAALKAASRGLKSIMLCEHHGQRQYGNNVHVYQGSLAPIASHEETEFTKKFGIRTKPKAMKVGLMKRGGKVKYSTEDGGDEDSDDE